jgi:hypothetical protein
MANDPNQPRRGPSDATDYSSTKAPETQAAAEGEAESPVDPRLHPGGAHGTHVDPGMSSLDDATVPSDLHRRP